ncbi:DUF1540 domain-containing protein [Paenibacillus agricola]|uniref:DUF1540 domain-containing protein n=1 Tax=Paenibacillus agricola TaxID=2716264 RepID=A0ABX0J6A8_9BACL|nr:DUF1540 domain-containing protein [Paenibacillus agricola]NHN30916.1 DUF1540 domain-containing protein [Paenibacillus agricola]
MPEVSCSVANCEYWAKDNKCRAASIMIDIDQHAHADYSDEFAAEPGSISVDHMDHAMDVKGTCCHTFQPKKK